MSKFPIEVKEDKRYGRGVFATRDIKKGSIVEVVPILKIGTYSKGNILKDYVWSSYVWVEDDEYYGNWRAEKAFSIIALGYGSLYNHNKNPNITFDRWHNKNFWEFKAVRDIKKGKQLFVSYGDKWFKSRGIKEL